MKYSLPISLAMLLILQIVHADVIELNNGKTMEGTFVGREGDTVKFNVDGIDMSFQASDVKNISMGAGAAPKAKTAKSNATAAGPATIAAGTQMTVRLTDQLDSGKHTTGHKFSGVLEGALVSGGVTVAPKDSKIYGVVSESVKSGRLAGSAKMLITITGININDQIVPVTTSSINAYTVPTGASSTGTVARGATIGALADGSSGARKGAKIGLGAAVLSGGNQVVIPPGTLVDFQLTQALTNK